MPKSRSTDKSRYDRRGDAPSSEVPPVPLSAGPESSQGDAESHAPTPDPQTPASDQKSFLGRAKESLSEVSSLASAAGDKAVAIGKSGAAKTAEISKQTYSAAEGATRDVLDAGKQAFTGSKLESGVNYIDSKFDQHGVKQAVKVTLEAVVGKLDQVTGKRLVELLGKNLQLQDAYNDVLATRLAEALKRIAKLEAEVKDVAARMPTSAPDSDLQPDAG